MEDSLIFLTLVTFISNFAIPDNRWRILEAFKKQILMWVWASYLVLLIFFPKALIHAIIIKDTHCDNISE